ncbi:MAG: hypothetical protein JO048_13400 [Methylobacteriaceae bacterium]|nr:hypothetical protein [Methylobacteriaceae bacterium]
MIGARRLAALALAAFAGLGGAQAQAPALPGTAGAADATLSLSAGFANDQRLIHSGIVWRVFQDGDPGAPPRLVTKSTAPNPSFALPPGTYTVHAAYGFAGAMKRVALGAAGASERVALNAGALKLAGAIGDVPIPADRVTFSIYLPQAGDSEGRLVASKVRPGEIVRLPEGGYHVVSSYGESNAIMRVDLRVETGKVTEATINHRAATVTLKLVANQGGEAFAGTAFSVLTPGGDVIREAIGSFPTVTLAEGEYVLIARNGGNVYTREFRIDSGLDRDIEVLVKTP